MINQPNTQESTPYVDMYKNLYHFVKTALAGKIDSQTIKEQINEIIYAFLNDPYNPLLLYSYTTSKDNYLGIHITNDIILAIGFGVSLNLSETNLLDLGICAFCHDFGMVEYTPLFQNNKKLSDYETQLIQKHSLKSSQIFKDIFSDDVIAGIEDVHENVDGTGYPKGKTGSEISFLAKILSICDVYEALTHPRYARERVIPYEAMKLIIQQKEKIFDTHVVKRFLAFMSIFPIGSLVSLNTGEIGMVTASNYGYPTRCVVKIILNANQKVEGSKKMIDLLQDTMVYVSHALHLKEESEILNILKPRGDIHVE
jgi:HD-GYP domain-containing protein (c-di-GMP phosphodiesterase class II)